MKDKYLACLITHGDLGCSLKTVAEKLVVPATQLFYFSNQEKSLEIIEGEITSLIKKEQPQKIFIFVDLVGSSCWLAAQHLKRNNTNISIISGINIPMLISFFINFQRLEWPELIRKIVKDGKKGILTA